MYPVEEYAALRAQQFALRMIFNSIAHWCPHALWFYYLKLHAPMQESARSNFNYEILFIKSHIWERMSYDLYFQNIMRECAHYCALRNTLIPSIWGHISYDLTFWQCMRNCKRSNLRKEIPLFKSNICARISYNLKFDTAHANPRLRAHWFALGFSFNSIAYLRAHFL